MWVHAVIFGILLVVFIGSKAGWFSSEKGEKNRSLSLFLAVALAGNLLGMALTVQNGGSQIYVAGTGLKKEEDQTYEEKFVVSVDGEKAGSMYVQIPEKELEEEREETQDQDIAPEQQQKKELEEAIANYNLEKNDPDYYYLPARWKGKQLEWEKPGSNTGNLLSFLFLITGTVLFLVKRREGQAALVKRQEELLMDYPGLIMKFTLLVQAGMTVRKIFQKMASDYQRKQGKQKRIAYEEILIVCHEMDSGVSEMEAYRRFGERCGQVKYKTFATLLIQNLQKGSRQLADMLEKESMEAWDERKRKARVLGEAAATKLLVPMILMLLVVMAVIMVPACLSFYGN